MPSSEATRGVRGLPLVTVGFRSLWHARGTMNVNLVPETPRVASLIHEQQDGPSPPKGHRARCAGVTSSAVNPTIEAAVIAAGSTVFITSVSMYASAWTTVRTLGTTV